MVFFNTRTNRALRAENAKLKAQLERKAVTDLAAGNAAINASTHKVLAEIAARNTRFTEKRYHEVRATLDATRAELAERQRSELADLAEARAELARRDRADRATKSVMAVACEIIRDQKNALDAAAAVNAIEASLRADLIAENEAVLARLNTEAQLNRRLLTAWHRLAGISKKARAHSVKVGPHHTPNFTKLEKAAKRA